MLTKYSKPLAMLGNKTFSLMKNNVPVQNAFQRRIKCFQMSQPHQYSFFKNLNLLPRSNIQK